ncbi:MAG: diaminopimelate decarboxylase [Pseudomonadota bacterium]
MNYFTYRRNRLYCEGVSLEKLCEEHGTPLYVYSHKTMVRHFRRVRESWKPLPVAIAYAMKANSNLSILRVLKKLGAWVDTVSGGEIYRALRAGFSPDRIIFGGVGKSREELRFAIGKKVFMIVADSFEELELISATAIASGKKVRIAVRVNPGVDPLTHEYVATGARGSKFGVSAGDALDCYKFGRSLPGIEVAGIHQHIGSQIVDLKPFLQSLRSLRDLVERIRGLGINLKWMDIGGGIGIRYRDEQPFSLVDFSQQIIPIVRESGCRLVIEPGRIIVGNAGALLTRVLYIKDSGEKKFVIVDAAMNDLIRPAFYNAYHEIIPVKKTVGTIVADVVGPVCESGDFLARGRTVAVAGMGDLYAVMSAGAYGFSMSSNYNSRPRAAEVLVSGTGSYLIRKRETAGDLVRGEKIARFLQED